MTRPRLLCLPAPPPHEPPSSPRTALAAATAALDAATPADAPLAALHAAGVDAQRSGDAVAAAAAYRVALARGGARGAAPRGGWGPTHANLAAALLSAGLPAAARAAADAALAALDASPLTPVASRARALTLQARALAATGEVARATAAAAAALRLAPHDVRARAAHAECVQAGLETKTVCAESPGKALTFTTRRPVATLTRVPPRAALAAAAASPRLPDRLLSLTALRHTPATRDAHAFVETACDVAAPQRAIRGACDGDRLAALTVGVEAAVQDIQADSLAPIVLDVGGGLLAGAGAAVAARAGARSATVLERWVYAADATRAVLDANGFDAARVRVVHARPTDASLARHGLTPANVLLVGGMVDDGLLTSGLMPALRHALASLTVPGVKVVPAAATLTIALVDTSIPLHASAGIPLTAAARAFAPPAPRAARAPPAGGWRLLSAAAPAFAFDLAAPPEDGDETVIDLTVTKAGTLTGVLAWPELDHGGGAAGVWCGAAPDASSPAPSLRPVFHPFAAPMTVTSGDIIRVHASHNTVASRFTLDRAAPPPRWAPGLPAWHAAALADATRNAAYGRAIEAAVLRARQRARERAAVGEDGRVVAVDGGASAGLFAALAAAAGADDVIAAEPLPAVADLARDLVAGAGVAEKVSVVCAAATALAAGAGPLRPLGADVIAVDAFDAGLLGADAAATIPRLVARLGAPGVDVVPRAATLWCCGAALFAASPPTSPFTSLAPLDAYWWRAGSPAAVDADALPVAALTAPARVWSGAFDGRGPPAEPLRGGGVPVTLDVTAAGEMNAVVVWFDVDMGNGETVTTVPTFITPTAPPTHWGAGLQMLDRWLRVAPGDRARLVARPPPDPSGPGAPAVAGVRFALRAQQPSVAGDATTTSRWAPRPPWTETWGGGDAVENPHVARTRYADLLLVELAQRAPCGRWPAVEGDVAPLLHHSGALALDPAATAAALERATLREAHAIAAAGGGADGVPPPVEFLVRDVVRG